MICEKKRKIKLFRNIYEIKWKARYFFKKDVINIPYSIKEHKRGRQIKI
jgi:hypothetical protein